MPGRIRNFFIMIIFILALTVATAPLQAANEEGDINDGSCTGWGWPLPYEQECYQLHKEACRLLALL